MNPEPGPAVGAPAVDPDSTSFLGMRPMVGDTLQLDLPPALGPGKTYVRLLGYLKDRFLIVTTPVADGHRLQLIENDSLLVRGFSGTKAYAFRSAVIHANRLPIDHVYLSYPLSVVGRPVRHSPRVRTDLVARLGPAGTATGQGAVEVRIRDMGALGALIVCPQEFAEGHKILLGFDLHVHDHPVKLEMQAIVVSHGVEGSGENAAHRLGVKFAELDPQTAMQLKAFVYQQLVDSPDRIV